MKSSVFSLASKSEGSLSTQAKSKPIKLGENGMYVEAVFTSLNNQSKYYEARETKNGNEFLTSDTVGERAVLNAVGLGVGYRYSNVHSIGFDGGGQIIQESNRLGGTHSAFYQIMGNINYTFVPHFNAYVGTNITYIDSKMGNDYYNVNSEPNIGGQIGLGYSIKGFSVKLGFQYVQYKIQYQALTNSQEVISYKTDGADSGAITQIGYVF